MVFFLQINCPPSFLTHEPFYPIIKCSKGGSGLQKRGYIPGLDGLRFIAVSAVIIYHLHYTWAPGGFLGVDIFLVLSGYLISDILLRQWNQHHRLDLRTFWIRRAKRLLPALYSMLILVIVFSFFMKQTEFPALRKDGFASFFYVSNWWYIFHDVSYFDSFGPPSPFEHLWSLAVEEQFYLLFPLLLLTGLRLVSKTKWLLVFSLVLAALSGGLMAWLYQPGTDPSRVYFGTDTRSFAFLIGCSLAILCPIQSENGSSSRLKKWLTDILGLVCLVILLFCIFRISEYDTFLFQGGMVLISFVTAVLIGVIVQPGSMLGQMLAWKPFKWVGERSYGIYLWHFPVIILSSPSSNISEITMFRMIFQVIGTVALAAASFRWIENPIRYGRVSRSLIIKSSFAIATGVLFLLLPVPKDVMSSTATVNSAKKNTKISVAPDLPPSPTINHSLLEKLNPIPDINRIPKQAPKPEQEPKPGSTPNPKPDSTTNQTPNPKPDPTKDHKPESKPNPTPTPKPKPNPTPNPTPPPNKNLEGIKVTAIGDSVMLNLEPHLKKLIPGIVVDGKVSRQLVKTPPVIANLKASGKLGNVVIIELGTNGPFTYGQLENLYHTLGNPKQVIFVNTRVPRKWESVVNSLLAEFVAKTPNATLVDWYTHSANHGDYFVGDGVHLTSKGGLALATLIQEAIRN